LIDEDRGFNESLEITARFEALISNLVELAKLE
jgi:hypothetical protein